MKHIYVVCRSGPEWNDIIQAFENKKDAEKCALDCTIANAHYLDEMSVYVIRKIKYNEFSSTVK